jgi:hypothetical protein
LLKACANGWASQIVSREPETGKFCLEVLKRGQALQVSKIVLRKSARVKRDAGKGRRLADLEERSDLFVNLGDEFVRRKSDGLRVGGAAKEASEESMRIGGAAGKERGVPDAAESAKTRGTRDEEAKAVKGMGYRGFGIAEGDDGDGSVLDGGECGS